MLITSDLAQQIVDSIMPLARQNVNIMDTNGIIIASGQKNRIKTFHKGAKEVIDNKAVVEINPDELDRYPGSLPGLNLPIMLKGQAIGVVGVSGPPDTIRNTAQMVKLVTELILERELLWEEFRSLAHLKKQFALPLLSDQAGQNYENLLMTANVLKYNLKLPRLVIVVDLQPVIDDVFQNNSLHDLISIRTRETVITSLENSSLLAAADFAVFLEERLVILKHIPQIDVEPILENWVTNLLSLLKTAYKGTPRIGAGSWASVYTELHQSYREALFALNHCSTERHFASIYDFSVLASYILKGLHANSRCHALLLLEDKVTRMNKKYDMLKTIQVLLACNLNLTLTAKSLYIHRNTLLFRLEMLKKATFLDPFHDFDHTILCKVIVDCRL